MPGRLRRKPVQSARHELIFRQDNYTGQNIDTPSSELTVQDGSGMTARMLARIENAICYGKFIEPIKGTQRFSYAPMPGSGEIYAGPVQHPTTQKFLLHRGTQLWTADENANFWEEVTALSSDTVPGSYSSVQKFDDNFVVFTQNGIFLTYFSDKTQNEYLPAQPIYFKLNSNCPANRPGQTSQACEERTFTTDYESDSNLTLSDALFLKTGMPVTVYSVGGTVPSPLEENVTYYVIRTDNTTYSLAETQSDAENNNEITLTDDGSGTLYIRLSHNYEYRYYFTFLRMVRTDGTSATGLDRRNNDVIVLSETGIKKNYSSNAKDWGVYSTCFPIDDQNPNTFYTSVDELVESADVDIDENTILINYLEDTYDTGQIIQFSVAEGGSLPGGISADTCYYAINDTDDASGYRIKVASSLSNALSGTAIDLTSTGSDFWVKAAASENKDDAHTHIGIYRSLNIKGSTTDGFDPISNEGNNTEIASWVGDVDIDAATFKDKTNDTQLRAEIARRFALAKMRGFEPLPSGNVGVIGQGWLFTATRGDATLYYSSLSEIQKTFAGHYSPTQYHKFDQGIQELKIIDDILVVLLSNQTKLITLTSFRNTGLLEFVPMLDHFPDGDKALGVLDYGSIAEIEQGTLIAVCSDHSVRIWNGSRWGDDLSHDLVRSEICKMVRGSVAAYFNGRYYLWYRTDSSKTYNNKCISLGVGKNAGRGWTFVTGDNWIYPPLYTGVATIQDKNDLRKLVVLDHVDKYLYWIDTYNSYDGSQTSESYAHKKIDGGFCPLGSKYWYDEMDDNSNSSDLDIGTAGSGTATETNNHMEINTFQDTGDKARVILDKEINTGDIDASVRQTYQDWGTGSGTIKWEIKIADFSSNTDQIDINDLNQGFLAYIEGNANNSGIYTAYWNFLAGSTNVTGNTPLSGRPYKLRAKRDANTLSVWADDKFVTQNTNAAWGTLSGMKASFSYDGNEGGDIAERPAGFNAFNVISDQMALDCLGEDGLGSETVASDKRIASLIRFPQITGIRESHNVKHRESHVYLRPIAFTYFHPAFEVDWKMYKDDGDEPIETVTDVKYSGDVQNWREVEGRRIQPEINTNLSKWKLTGFDSLYWSEDKKDLKNDPGCTEEADWQEELATNLDFWLTRRNYTKDFATGNAMTESLSGSSVVGPDGDSSSAYEFASQTQVTGSYTELSGDFTVMFWIKNPCTIFTYYFFKVSGTNSLVISFGGALGIGSNGAEVLVFDTDTVGNEASRFGINDADDGNWHHFALIRNSSEITLRQNNVLRQPHATQHPNNHKKSGSVFIDSTTYGGTGAVAGRDGVQIEDLRVYTKAISQNALNYYYDNVLDGGDKILPL